MTLKQFLEALNLRQIADPSINPPPVGTRRPDFEPTRPAVHHPYRSSTYETETQGTVWQD